MFINNAKNIFIKKHFYLAQDKAIIHNTMFKMLSLITTNCSHSLPQTVLTHHLFILFLTHDKQNLFILAPTHDKQNLFILALTHHKQNLFILALTIHKQNLFILALTHHKQNLFILALNHNKKYQSIM